MYESGEAERYVNDGDESDPLGSDQEVTFRIAPELVTMYIDVDDCEKEYSACDVIYGQSIDNLVIERHQGRRCGPRCRGPASVRFRFYEIPNQLNPNMESSNMTFTSKDFDLTERLLSGLLTMPQVLVLRTELLGSFTNPVENKTSTQISLGKGPRSSAFDGELWKRNAAI